MSKNLGRAAAVQFLFALIVLGTACKPSGQTDSETRHSIGDTVQKRSSPLRSCKEAEKASAHPSTARAKLYLEKILDVIISENNRSTNVFKGYFARENFCVSVVNDNATSNAFADPETGLIEFYTGMFLEMESDAMVASVLAHELAHITLDHSTRNHTFKTKLTNTELLSLQSDQQLLVEMADKVQFLKSKIFEIYNIPEEHEPNSTKDTPIFVLFERAVEKSVASGKCGDRCTQFRSFANELIQILKSAEVILERRKVLLFRHFTAEEIANKSEADADEVGLEFVVRADIDPAETLEHWRMNARTTLAGNDCHVPATRGTGTHPSSCWRSFNIANELVEHSEVYKKFLKNRRKNFIAQPTLSEIKADIVNSVKKTPMPDQPQKK